MSGARGGLRARGLAAGLAALFVLAPAAGPAQDGPYRLEPGDRVRVAVAGMREMDAEFEVDVDGMLNLPQAGRLEAAGRTLVELETELRARAAGQALKRYTPNGEPVFIPLAAEDVSVAIVGYRPLFVSGDVQRPGLVEFRPGMTARAAVSVAGGVARVAAVGVDPAAAAMQAPRLQADFRSFAFAQAGFLARLWGIDATLAGDPDLPRPQAAVAVSPEVFDAMLAEQRRRVVADIDQLEQERGFLARAIEESDSRLDVLTRQAAAQRESVEIDETEYDQARASLARGVIQLSRVQDIRRNLNLSATRLLETENNQSRVAIERGNFERQLATLESTRMTRLAAERETVSQRLLETGPRLTAAREQLELNGLTPAGVAGAEVQEALVVAQRRLGGVVAPVPLTLDEPVRPGDVLTVTLPAVDETGGAFVPTR